MEYPITKLNNNKIFRESNFKNKYQICSLFNLWFTKLAYNWFDLVLFCSVLFLFVLLSTFKIQPGSLHVLTGKVNPSILIVIINVFGPPVIFSLVPSGFSSHIFIVVSGKPLFQYKHANLLYQKCRCFIIHLTEVILKILLQSPPHVHVCLTVYMYPWRPQQYIGSPWGWS